MNFNDAWEKANAKTPSESRIKETDNQSIVVAKTLALFWSIMSIALQDSEGENVLDDTAYIGNDMSIVSIPLETLKKDDTIENEVIEAEEETEEEITPEEEPVVENIPDEPVENAKSPKGKKNKQSDETDIIDGQSDSK